MALTQEEKEKTIAKYKLHNKDTGSPEVQAALISEEIRQLLLHLKTHPKDLSSKRGLLKMVSKRRKLLKFLKKENIRRHNKLIKTLGLKT